MAFDAIGDGLGDGDGLGEEDGLGEDGLCWEDGVIDSFDQKWFQQ